MECRYGTDKHVFRIIHEFTCSKPLSLPASLHHGKPRPDIYLAKGTVPLGFVGTVRLYRYFFDRSKDRSFTDRSWLSVEWQDHWSISDTVEFREIFDCVFVFRRGIVSMERPVMEKLKGCQIKKRESFFLLFRFCFHRLNENTVCTNFCYLLSFFFCSFSYYIAIPL